MLSRLRYALLFGDPDDSNRQFGVVRDPSGRSRNNPTDTTDALAGANRCGRNQTHRRLPANE